MKFRTNLSRVMIITGLLCAGILTEKTSAQAFRKANSFEQNEKAGLINCQVKRSESGDLTVKYSFPDVKVEKNRKLNDSSVSVSLGSAPVSADVGKPVLPIIPLKLILAPGKTISSIEVITGSKKRVKGSYKVIHNMGYVPLKEGEEDKEPAKVDESIYSKDEPFPYNSHERVTIQKKRGVSIAYININPVRYQPKSGTIYSFDSLEIRIKTSDIKESFSLKKHTGKIDVKSLGVENPEEIDSYSMLRSEKPLAIFDYMIITSQNIIDATTDYTIHDLAEHRENRGLKTVIFSIESILTTTPGVDDAEKLRNFIIDSYNDYDISYVLLGGDINIIPMRKLYCYASGETDLIPSDLYYQCLDGTYNSDGDANWGETTDGENGGDIDLLSEINIGRASAQNANEMANFVYKTIAYETASSNEPNLRTALMCGEYLGFGGVSDFAKNSMEEIRLGSSANGYTTAGFAASPSFTVNTLYDADEPGNDWPQSSLINLINSNDYSIINHLGHANNNYVMKLYNNDADALTNTNYLFAYSQGCIPGDFESDCIGEHFTTSNRNGMYAVVFNSRYGWGSRNSTDGPSQRFDRQFWDAYFDENLMTLGELNTDSHEDNIYDINGSCIRWCFYETNLLGDPAVNMRGKYTGPYLSYTNYNIVETKGNSDGFVSPGEEISINVSLGNVGISTANNVTATLQTTNSYVSILNNNANYGNIAPGETRSAISPFIVEISSNCQTPQNVVFTLNITDSEGNNWSSGFSINVFSIENVNGSVRSYTGNLPASGAEISYNGPITGKVITDQNGLFSINMPYGTYSLVASDSNFLQSEPVEIVIPRGTNPVEIFLRRSDLHINVSSLSVCTRVGAVKDTVITITNNGDADLTIGFSTEYSDQNQSSKVRYDSTHFIALKKGEEDKRIGNPVPNGFGGPDAYGYKWCDSDEPSGPRYIWNDISLTGTLLSISSSDDDYQSVDLGFLFEFYGKSYNTAYVGSNGYITFGSGSYEYTNYPLPSAYAPSNLIAAFYDDLYPESSGDIYFQSFSDRAVVQFSGVNLYNGSGKCTFQMVLHRNGKICFYYNSLTGTTTSATAGIQNSTSDTGLGIVYNGSYFHDGLAVEISNSERWINIDQENDIIAPSESRDYKVSLGNADLLNGVYYGSILINNNDPRRLDPIVLPVVLNITNNIDPPEITVHPESQTVEENQSVTFTVVATGQDLVYQWLRNESQIAGANSSNYTLSKVSRNDNGDRFRCIVSNSSGSVESDEALLTVNILDPPVIIAHPLNQTVIRGETVSFSVVATGTGLSYQWFKNENEIAGAAGMTLTIDTVSVADSGSSFMCIITNSAGMVSSNPAILTVLTNPVYHTNTVRIGISSQSTSKTQDYKTKGLIIGSACAGKMTGTRFIYYAQ